jgi:hypothetical protein
MVFVMRYFSPTLVIPIRSAPMLNRLVLSSRRTLGVDFAVGGKSRRRLAATAVLFISEAPLDAIVTAGGSDGGQGG